MRKGKENRRLEAEVAALNADRVKDLETELAAVNAKLVEANDKAADYQNRLSEQRDVIEEYENTIAAKVAGLDAEVCAFVLCMFQNGLLLYFLGTCHTTEAERAKSPAWTQAAET